MWDLNQKIVSCKNNNEEGDDDQVHFQLKMDWEEGYSYVNY
jgi:hypothetical protein